MRYKYKNKSSIPSEETTVNSRKVLFKITQNNRLTTIIH